MAAVDTISQTLTSARDTVMGATSAQSGQEPPSGVQGKGTVEEPYDQGNAQENIIVQSAEEPLSGVQGKGTATDPYDKGNAGETTNIAKTTKTTSSSLSPNDERTNPLQAQSKNRSIERDVSPGTLPDGSHAKTSGDRGESYEPARGLNKLKGKLGFGRH